MTDDSVIEEAAKAIADFQGVRYDRALKETWDGMAHAAFAVFEKAHAKELHTSPEPVKNEGDSLRVATTDDEREAEARKYATDRYREVIYLSEYNAAVSAFVEGAMWRSSEPQDEPTAAHVLEDFLGKLAGSGAYVLDFTSAVSLHGHIVRILKRDIAALRAAGEVK